MSEVEKAIACANWLNEHRQFVACYAVGNNESGGEWEVVRIPRHLNPDYLYMSHAQLIEFCEVRGYPGDYHDPIVKTGPATEGQDES